MDHYMGSWMSGGHGITMILGWAAIIIGLIAVGYAWGRSGRERDRDD